MSEPQFGTWQPIETAPRDGAPLIVFDGEFITTAWWQADFSYDYDDENEQLLRVGAWTDGTVQIFGYEKLREVKPTHWMPLPPAPEVKP